MTFTAPRPNPSLLAECVDPPIIEDAKTATDTDVGLAYVRANQAYLDCRRKHADLSKWVKGTR